MRELETQDGARVHALVLAAYGGTRHLVRMRELIELALAGSDPECLALAAATDDGSIEGVLLYGTIGGAAGVVKVHAVIGIDLEALGALIDGVFGVAPPHTTRMFVCELAADIEQTHMAAALMAHGFTRETTVADYFAEGIGLEVLVLRVPSIDARPNEDSANQEVPGERGRSGRPPASDAPSHSRSDHECPAG